MSKTKLKLTARRWYGWQMLPGYSVERNVPYFSPIWVEVVTPRKTGRSIVTLQFFNAFYAEGVQGFKTDLRIVKHEANYLVAEIFDGDKHDNGRTAIVSQLEFEWLERFCPELWRSRPPSSFSGPEQTSVSYLKALFPYVGQE